MRDKKSVSVILVTYKSALEKVLRTLKSVFDQSLEDVEIIVADDATPDFQSEILSNFLENHSPYPYKILRNLKNLGTVKNVLNASKTCNGEYIKPIGAGDILYNRYTLENVISYMESKKACCCFGLMKGYTLNENSIEFIDIKRPRVIDVYKKNQFEKIKKNIILGDHPSGAALFYRRDYAIKCWTAMVQNSSTKYCEDVITYQIVLEGEVPLLYPHCVVWYEVNTGISKRDNKSKINTNMYSDILTYIDFLIDQYPNDNRLLKTKRAGCEFQIKNASHLKRFLSYLANPRKLLFELYVRINSYNTNDFDDESGYLVDDDWLRRFHEC
ncbi:glycosyltransferase [uncultured Faecalibaculum sp.]|uniref:glycosyltransferase n=1 Tax=uncultured Faecalibaculum sp. TaxID=1729681 RepID=UPI00272EB446|nr:glycosyltransferase [uncultured Faecalibaculum sp.]